MVRIEKNSSYGETGVTIIGLTNMMYGRPQYVLVDSDEGKLKFPGLRFRAPMTSEETLEDAAKSRFEEQTGLEMEKMLGLRVVMPTRSRHRNQWIFRNIFLGIVEDFRNVRKNDRNRRVYLADAGQGLRLKGDYAIPIGKSKEKRRIDWVSRDNTEVAKITTDFLHNFDWEMKDSKWYRRIPCVGARPLAGTNERPLGCGLAVASIVLLYKPSLNKPHQVILLQRKGDNYPGYAGGKVETPDDLESRNLDPISCCAKEGAEEFGFDIQPRALICCANTALDVPNGDDSKYYNGITTYAFIAEPVHPLEVKAALRNPRKHLEGKMERYVIETLDEHRDRIASGHMRMPDMVAIGEQFYRTSPGEKIPLTHFRASGAY
jgi:8-oxo-dGTP pyrophosphatase MutT (NUDIX family)